MNNFKCIMIKAETENSGSTVYIVCWFITLWPMQISYKFGALYMYIVPVMISKVTLSSFFSFLPFPFSFLFFVKNAARKRKFSVIVAEGAPFYKVWNHTLKVYYLSIKMFKRNCMHGDVPPRLTYSKIIILLTFEFKVLPF